MKRFFEPQSLEAGMEVSLSARNFHYLKHVLRMNEGARIELFNDSGNAFVCSITSIGKKEITVHVDEQLAPSSTESQLHTHLGLVLSKGDRFDYALQKATELGVNEITPLTSLHCDVRLNASRMDKKQQHWIDTVISASEQSGRTRVPNVNAVMELEAWSNTVQTTKKWVFHTRNETDDISCNDSEAISSLAILIGPEGGLHNNEVAQATESGFEIIQLGNRILRTETAPIVALTLAQFTYGDFSQ